MLLLLCFLVISFSKCLEADPTYSPLSKVEPQYDYREVLEKSYLFYEAQRSGKLAADNRIPWRGDSALDDGQAEGYDLSGGYFDAGDFVKFGFPMAYTMAVLAWGVIDYKQAYINAGQLEYAHAAIRWGTDYFIKAHVADDVFYGQCGDGNKDHAYWGRPEEMTMDRPCWAISPTCPGSELAAETAAALAAASIMFADTDQAYSDECLNHAIKLFNLGKDHLGLYHECITNAADFYKSWSGYWDELAWAGAWMYKATGDEAYITYVEGVMTENGLLEPNGGFGWDDKTAGAQVMMYKLTDDEKYIAGASSFCEAAVDPDIEPYFTPKGLVYLGEWGSLRQASNAVFICLQVADLGINTESNMAFAKQQIGYALGDTGRSFVCGHGSNPPTHPHHRASSCPIEGVCDWDNFYSNSSNPQVLFGALVGGPNELDEYEDDREDYVRNEVAMDYNAGFTAAVARLSLEEE